MFYTAAVSSIHRAAPSNDLSPEPSTCRADVVCSTVWLQLPSSRQSHLTEAQQMPPLWQIAPVRANFLFRSFASRVISGEEHKHSKTLLSAQTVDPEEKLITLGVLRHLT